PRARGGRGLGVGSRNRWRCRRRAWPRAVAASCRCRRADPHARAGARERARAPRRLLRGAAGRRGMRPSLTARDVAARVRAGSLTAAAVLEDALGRIAAEDGRLRAFVEVFADRARREAQAIDAARAAGERLGPLAGVPVAIKDMFAREGCQLTRSSTRL